MLPWIVALYFFFIPAYFLNTSMARLHAATDEEMGAELCQQLDKVVPGNKLPPVYRQMGNSPEALAAYLAMEAAINAGSLDAREAEAVKLAVSELNQCDYCLSVHSVKSVQAGLDTDLQLLIRRGKATGDERLDAIVTVARQFFIQPGTLPDEMLTSVRKAGITDKNLLDIVLATSTIFLTNTFNHLNDTELSFKPAPALDS